MKAETINRMFFRILEATGNRTYCLPYVFSNGMPEVEEHIEDNFKVCLKAIKEIRTKAFKEAIEIDIERLFCEVVAPERRFDWEIKKLKELYIKTLKEKMDRE